MMVWKTMKYAAAAAALALVVGTVLFGSEVWSYARGSVSSVRASVRDSVPVEFEIHRAQEMAEQIVPELRANIRRIAEEEVEVARLEKDITDSTQRLAEQRRHLLAMRERLAANGAGDIELSVNGRSYDRQAMAQEVADRFAHFREAEDILAGKQRLLESRKQSLAAAEQALAKTRRQKQRIEQQIAALEAQHRLVQSASTGSQMTIDGSQLAQTQKLVDRIKQRLDVAERVLAHEARFTQHPVFEQSVDADRLIEEMSAHFGEHSARGGLTRHRSEPTGEAAQ